MKAPLPPDEERRLAKLLDYKILDTEPETAYDDLVRLAACICGTPISLVSLVDRDRQWFKAKVGLTACETSRDVAFCAHAILAPEVMVIPDATKDPRFANNPLVTGEPHIRFYAGAPLRTPDGYSVGTLCAIDTQPRQLSAEQIAALEALGRQVVTQLELRATIQRLRHEAIERKRAEMQLIQSEKMASLGQLVAGVAHEINNPVSFICGNLSHAEEYFGHLLAILTAYRKQFPQPNAELAALIAATDLDFLLEDMPKLLRSMSNGVQRIKGIVQSLRIFSRLDESALKEANLNDCIDSTLTMLDNRIQPKTGFPGIQLVKHYGQLPEIQCYARQLNQVFLHILTNAIDALEERDRQRSQTAIQQQPSRIEIRTEVIGDVVRVAIADNGPGIAPEIKAKIFDPFFTTKPVGKGTGLGLSTSYEIITQKHSGRLTCRSESGQGAEFVIEIPIFIRLQEKALSGMGIRQMQCNKGGRG